MELGYLRIPAATYGIFDAIQDNVVFARRLPASVRTYLASVAEQLVSSGHAALIDDFIRDMPPRISRIGYASAVFHLRSLFRILYELGDERFRAISEEFQSYILALGSSKHAPHTSPRPNLHEILPEDNLECWTGIATTNKGPDDPAAVLLTVGLGPYFEPWRLPDAVTQAESLHAIVSDKRAPWPRRRDAAVLLCNAPVETRAQARELVVALSGTVARCDSYPIACGMWARAEHVGRLVLSQDEPWRAQESRDERLDGDASRDDLTRIQSLAEAVVRYYANR